MLLWYVDPIDEMEDTLGVEVSVPLLDMLYRGLGLWFMLQVKDEAVLVPALMVELKLNVLAEVISEVREEDEAAAVAATCCMCLMSLRVTMVDLGLDRAVMGSTIEAKVVTVSTIES